MPLCLEKKPFCLLKRILRVQSAFKVGCKVALFSFFPVFLRVYTVIYSISRFSAVSRLIEFANSTKKRKYSEIWNHSSLELGITFSFGFMLCYTDYWWIWILFLIKNHSKLVLRQKLDVVIWLHKACLPFNWFVYTTKQFDVARCSFKLSIPDLTTRLTPSLHLNPTLNPCIAVIKPLWVLVHSEVVVVIKKWSRTSKWMTMKMILIKIIY